MQQLELKHIAPYLPFNLEAKQLNFKRNYNGNETGIIEGYYYLYDNFNKRHLSITFNNNSTGQDVDSVKPLLRPMSDLFENIVHNEEIVCVAKVIKNLDYSIEWWNESRTALHYPETGEFCITSSDYELDYKSLDYSIIETLFKYHFDVFGLIEKGLAEPIKNK